MSFSDDRGREVIIFKTKCKCNNLIGDLIVTSRGVYFDKASGFLGTGKTRIHHYGIEDIQDVRIESKGISGSLTGQVVLAIDHRTPNIMGRKTNRYNMSKTNANRVIYSMKQMRTNVTAPDQLKSLLLRLVKPQGEADLRKIASRNDVRILVAPIRRVHVSQLHHTDVFFTVRGIVGGSLTATNNPDKPRHF